MIFVNGLISVFKKIDVKLAGIPGLSGYIFVFKKPIRYYFLKNRLLKLCLSNYIGVFTRLRHQKGKTQGYVLGWGNGDGTCTLM